MDAKKACAFLDSIEINWNEKEIEPFEYAYTRTIDLKNGTVKKEWVFDWHEKERKVVFKVLYFHKQKRVQVSDVSKAKNTLGEWETRYSLTLLIRKEFPELMREINRAIEIALKEEIKQNSLLRLPFITGNLALETSRYDQDGYIRKKRG